MQARGIVRDWGNQTPWLSHLPSILFLFGTKTVFLLKDLITRVTDQGDGFIQCFPTLILCHLHCLAVYWLLNMVL